MGDQHVEKAWPPQAENGKKIYRPQFAANLPPAAFVIFAGPAHASAAARY